MGEAPAADGMILISHPVAGVAVITMNRAKARNALSLSMMRAMRDGLSALEADGSVAAIVIAGAGPAFSSGHDLKELSAHRTDSDGGRAFYAETMALCSDLMQAIVRSPKPVIAAVNAMATAAGCQLVASCDLAVASETAQFCTPGVNIGLFCSTPMVALSRNVSRKRAMEMLLLGETLSAAEAETCGLINRAVAPDRLMQEAIAMGAKIAAKSPATVAIGKAAFYNQIEMGLAEAYEHAAKVMVANMMMRDAQEGIDAFLEKRTPNWKGC